MHSLFFISVANTPLGHQATSYEWFFFSTFKNCFYLSIYFRLHRVLVCSGCGRRGLLSSVVCRLSLWWPLLQSMGSGHSGFSTCGSQARLPWGMWDLPRPGVKPMSPALGGGFSCTGRMSPFIFEIQLTYNTMLVPVIKSCHLWINGSGGYYAKWNQSDKKWKILYDFTYVWKQM